MNVTLTLGDIIEISIAVVIITVFLASSIYRYVKQFICKHKDWYTPSLSDHPHHDICRNCGKDLGFKGSENREKAREEKGK